MTAMPDPSAGTRERILDAALDLFARNGFAGTSVRQLAQAVGLRESSLYNHFAGKAAIYHALIDSHGPASSAERLRGPRYQALGREPEAFLRLYAADLLDQWCDPREQKFQEMIQAERQRLAAERAHFQETLFAEELGVVADHFRDFALAGLIRVPDPKETARLFMAGCTFIRMEHLLIPARPSSRATVAEALDRFLATFLTLIAPEA
jgi:AcrR family transcriptional regulator